MNKSIHQNAEGRCTGNTSETTDTESSIDHTHGDKCAGREQKDSSDKDNNKNHEGSYHEQMMRRIAIGAGVVSLLSLASSIFSAWSAWDSSSAAISSAGTTKSAFQITRNMYEVSRSPQMEIMVPRTIIVKPESEKTRIELGLSNKGSYQFYGELSSSLFSYYDEKIVHEIYLDKEFNMDERGKSVIEPNLGGSLPEYVTVSNPLNFSSGKVGTFFFLAFRYSLTSDLGVKYIRDRCVIYRKVSEDRLEAETMCPYNNDLRKID